MKNEPLDYFNKKNEPPYTLKSYRKLIIVIILMMVVGLIVALFEKFAFSNFMFLLGVVLFFLIIPFFSFWGLINIFQSYYKGEEKTTKRTVVLVFHALILVSYVCYLYWLNNTSIDFL